MKNTVFILLISLVFFQIPAGNAQEQQIQEPTLWGVFEQGGIVFGQAHDLQSIQLNGKEVLFSEQGEFVFGFAYNETQDAELTLHYTTGESWSHTYPVQAREFKIQRIDGLPQQTVTPNPEVTARIKKDNEQVWLARQHRTTRNDFIKPFIWPADGPITGVYGSQRILNGVPKAPHYGLDIAAPTGTVAVAPAAGIVRLVAPDMVLSGGTLIIDHGYGFFSTFLHLSAIDVQVGQEVKQGEPVARIGATGRATGPHLDWRINWGDVRLDPYYLIRDAE